MEEFDIQMSMNGVRSEVNTKSSRFDGEVTDVAPIDDIPKVDKKDWIDTLATLTKQFKSITGYKTPEELKAQKEKELAEKGTKYKIVGMNPFVAIALSFGIILVGSYFVVKIKAK
tara:strand:- start:197 stop:541 length:345 start_codon:yes stop_codon:yes gene_type:complete